MKLLTISSFLLLSGLGFGQPQIKGNFAIPTSEYKQEDYDESNYTIYYDFSAVNDVTKADKPKKGISVLQIGNRYSKYVDFNQLKYDSINEQYSHLNEVGTNELNLLLKVRYLIQQKEIYLYDNTNNLLLTQATIYKDRFEFKEPLPQQDWKMTNETKSIGGYLAKKATTTFRGRNWTAWYTEEIPLSTGPHKFNGLPGLIIALSDADNYFTFTLKGLDQKRKKIYLENVKTIQTTREVFRETERKFNENPDVHITAIAYDSNKEPIKGNGKSFAYNPIELQ